MIRALLLVSCLLLASCGFHLRQTATLPARFAHISVLSHSEQSRFAQQLQNYLIDSGVRADPHSPWQIMIIDEKWYRSGANLNSNSLLRQYHLIYQVTWQLHKQGKPHGKAITLSSMRQLDLSPQVVQGAEFDETLIRQELMSDNICKLIARLRSQAFVEQAK